MEGEYITVKICGKEKTYAKGTQYLELAEEYQKDFSDDIILVSVNNRLCELHNRIKKGGEVTFVTTADRAGRKAYRRSVTLLMQKAVHNLWGEQHVTVKVMYSIGQGYYCALMQEDGEKIVRVKVGNEKISALKREMYRLVMADLEIEKQSITTDEAVQLFHDLKMRDKEKLFRYRRSSRVNIYELDHYKDYFYGFMLPSTGYLRYYDVVGYEDGFVLLFPGDKSREIDEFSPSKKLFLTLKRGL